MPWYSSFLYSKNNNHGLHPIGFNSAFTNYYINNGIDNNKFQRQGIPGIRFGAVLRNKLEISATLGYYKLKWIEKPLEVDTLVFSGFYASPNSPSVQGLTRQGFVWNTRADAVPLQNTLRYIYGSVDLSWIIPFRKFKLKPGMSVAMSRVIASDYMLVDQNGYSYQSRSTRYLNKNMVNVILKAGLAKRFGRFEMQLSPALVVSPTSLFDRNYFIKQRMYGFGLEGAVLYTFARKIRKQ
jgi:hypothetical protein